MSDVPSPGARGGSTAPGRRRAHRSRRRRPLRRLAVAALVLLLAVPAGALAWAQGELQSTVDLGTLAERGLEQTERRVAVPDGRARVVREQRRDLRRRLARREEQRCRARDVR